MEAIDLKNFYRLIMEEANEFRKTGRVLDGFWKKQEELYCDRKVMDLYFFCLSYKDEKMKTMVNDYVRVIED